MGREDWWSSSNITYMYVSVQISIQWDFKVYQQKLKFGFFPGEIKIAISASRILNNAILDQSFDFYLLWIINEINSNF